MAVTAWNVMGGLDWQAIPVVAEMLGVTNIEALIARLVAIRSYHDRPRKE